MLFIVEHCERGVSEWMELEYRHCGKIAGGELLFTNVSLEKDQRAIGKIGHFRKESAADFLKGEKVIVLDPQTDKLLSPDDFKLADKIVIGGILGDAMPRGRTKDLITSKLNGIPRSIGQYQLSIDGACFMAKKVADGAKLEDVLLSNKPEIEFSENESITLDYAIPVFEGKPVLTPGLLEYLRKKG
ncbi:MAG: hypothetical protein ABH829_01585 [archaeon]